MKRLLTMLILLALMTSTAFALVYGADNYKSNRSFALTNSTNDPIRRFMVEVDTVLTGGIGSGLITGTGTIYYVDSNVSTAGDGSSWTNALETIEAGYDECSANVGDTVYVAPGHSETLGTLAMDTEGVIIRGFGYGEDIPEIIYNGTGDVVAITAASNIIYNISFSAQVDAVISGITISANGDYTSILNCEFPEPSNSTYDFATAIQLATAADNVTIANCTYKHADAVGPVEFIDGGIGAVQGLSIIGNLIHGEFSAAPIFSDQTDTEMYIAYNTITNMTNNLYAINLGDSATGWLIGNKLATDTYATGLDPGLLSMDDSNVWTDYGAGDVTAVPYFTDVTGVSRWSASELTQKENEAIDAIEADYLDKLVSAADGTTNAYPTSVASHSILAYLMSDDADPDTSHYNNTTMSLEALNIDLDAIITDTAATLVDTGTTLPASISSIAASIAALSATGYVGTCTSNATTTEAVVPLLAGFGDDYFNTGWSMICVLNYDGPGTVPEGEIIDIIDYVSLDGTFTLNVAFSEALTTSDRVFVKRYEELNLDDVTMLGAAGTTVRYVDSTTGATGDGSGLSWENAYATLVLAEAASSAGDVIYVADGHNEGWTQASQPVIDVANLTIIGLGEGDARPLFDFDGNTTLLLTINAAGVNLKNLRFNPSASEMVTGIHFEAGAIGCTMENCSFVTGESSGDEWQDVILVDQVAAGLTIKNCTFENANATAGAGDTFINLEDTPVENVSIIGCTIFGDFADAPIFWGAGVPVNLLIKDNVISNTSTGQMCIEGSGNATGVCSDNRLYADTFGAVLDPGYLKCFENYVSYAIDSPAHLVPAVDDEIAEAGPGRIFYVDSGTPGAGDGRSWATAVATLDAGVNLCTDDRGDTIYVAAGHAEGTLTTEYADIDQGGITIIGLGNGDLRPTFTYTDTGGTLAIENDDITIKNLHFIAAADSVGVAITVKTLSENVTIEDCLFTVTTAGTHEFDICIDHAAANHNAVIKNCRFQMTAADAVAVVHFEDSDYAEIVGNDVHGDYSTACIHSDTTAADHIVIKHNVLFNGTIGGIGGLNTEPCIELLNTTTGVIADNALFCDEATPEDSIVALDMFLTRNTYSEIESSAGSRLIGDDQSIDVDIAALSGKGTGQVWYVDRSGSGEDGRSWASAFTTINLAEAACTADAGDIILVAEGHYEDLTGANAVDLDVAGISVFGMGVGDARPRLDFDDDDAEVTISKANITIKNIQFRPGLTATASRCIDIEAAGLGATIEDCAFLDGESAGTDEWLDTILIHNSAVGVTIRNCTFYSTGTDADSCINLETGAAANITVEDCTIFGDYDEAGIWGAAQVCLNLNIHDNVITNNCTGQLCIEFQGATTGMCTNNLMYADTRAAVFDPGSLKCFGNKNVILINEGAEDTPLIAGQSYVRVKTNGVITATDQLFTVAGSPIMITSFVGHATTAIGGACTLNIQVDATAAGEDYDLSTDVDIQAVDQGGLIVFSSALLEGVTTPAPLGATGCAATPLNWFVVPGDIESDAGGDTGAITWYMVFTPLGAGCTVVPQ